MSVLVATSVWIRLLSNRAPYAAEMSKLWTADSALATVATKLGIAYE